MRVHYRRAVFAAQAGSGVVERVESLDNYPLAYLVTVTCYGSHLHGHPMGSVGRDRNGHYVPQPPSFRREVVRRIQMSEQPYLLDRRRRAIVLASVLEVCRMRSFTPVAVHIRTNHFHAILGAAEEPRAVVNLLKRYASCALNRAGVDPGRKRRWTRGGSCVGLWREAAVDTAADYVLLDQGRAMERYPD